MNRHDDLILVLSCLVLSHNAVVLPIFVLCSVFLCRLVWCYRVLSGVVLLCLDGGGRRRDGNEAEKLFVIWRNRSEDCEEVENNVL